mmetsp:Transcript_19866/g.27724  ORF Transcript_19866/g.27724 Transcript_19866/m.27724 type:complete len:218 (+) Transcript_19866:126-779(+)
MRRRYRRSVKISAQITVEVEEKEGEVPDQNCTSIQEFSKCQRGIPCSSCPFSSSCNIVKRLMNGVEQPGEHNIRTVTTESHEGSQIDEQKETSSDEATLQSPEADAFSKNKNSLRASKPSICLECETMAKTGSTIYTMEHVSKHNCASSCWLVSHGIVYDATQFLDLHPAGRTSILRRGGVDATRDFDFHSSSAQRIWKKYRIGRLKSACNAPCVIS